MTDFLKEIWGRFEDKTTRTLTSSNVDNIPRPNIAQMERRHSLLKTAHEAADVPMPEGVTEPAQAAFDALRQRLTSYDDKGRPEPRKNAVPPVVVRDDQILRDLKETEKRTCRREMDYLSYAMKMQAEAGEPRKRKKFLGIF